jgi:PIN domain nuclease of toxin-antitoxin system
LETEWANFVRDRAGHSIIVPIIVLEEINRLAERKIVRLNVPFRRWTEELERSANFLIQAYTLEILLESISLAAIRDPADRAIVITADELIQEGDWVDTVWE